MKDMVRLIAIRVLVEMMTLAVVLLIVPAVTMIMATAPMMVHTVKAMEHLILDYVLQVRSMNLAIATSASAQMHLPRSISDLPAITRSLRASEIIITRTVITTEEITVLTDSKVLNTVVNVVDTAIVEEEHLDWRLIAPF